MRKPADLSKTCENYSVGTSWPLLVGRLHVTPRIAPNQRMELVKTEAVLGVCNLRN